VKANTDVINNYNLPDGSEKIVMQAHVFDRLSAFCSRSFIIRYCDEEIQLNDICFFRIELDAYPSYKDPVLFLECELMFSEYKDLDVLRSMVRPIQKITRYNHFRRLRIRGAWNLSLMPTIARESEMLTRDCMNTLPVFWESIRILLPTYIFTVRY
jgi:hypothetical protein